MRLQVYFLLLVAFVAACSDKPEVNSIDNYFDQTPPGDTAVVFAPGILSTGSHELDITITPDGGEIFFTRSGPDWFSSVLQFKRINNKWIGPLMPAFSGKYQNNYPFVSPDGLSIVYNSQEPVKDGQTGGSNIFVSKLISGEWGDGLLLDSTLNINGTEMYVSLAANGNIYFGARYEKGLGGCDIYMCEYLGKSYGKATNLGSSINSEHNEFHCYISPDESFLLFDANRPDGFGGNDIYISCKLPDGSWSIAKNLGEGINTQYSESRPYISPEGKYFFFCSTRAAALEEN